MRKNELSQDQLKEKVEKAQRGDMAAMESLIYFLQDDLYAFCFYLSNNNAQAEDLCQETLLKGIQKIRDLREPLRLKSWTLQIAKNLFFDGLKIRDNVSKDHEEELDQLEAAASDPDLNFQIRKALADLPPTDRLILILIDLYNYSYKEAGDFLKLSEVAVTSRVFRARQEFVKKIEKR